MPHTDIVEAPQWSPRLAEFVWQNGAIGMAFVGKNGQWLKVNPYLCRILEYTEDELLARTWMDVTDPRDTPVDQAEVRRVIAGERTSYTMIKRYVKKFGGTVMAELSVVPHMDSEDGDVAFFFSQIIPATTPPAVQAVRILSDDEEAAAAFRFLKKNWKWMVGLIIALLLLFGVDRVAQLLQMFHVLPPPVVSPE